MALSLNLTNTLNKTGSDPIDRGNFHNFKKELISFSIFSLFDQLFYKSALKGALNL